jgi:hypothetical protein
MNKEEFLKLDLEEHIHCSIDNNIITKGDLMFKTMINQNFNPDDKDSQNKTVYVLEPYLKYYSMSDFIYVTVDKHVYKVFKHHKPNILSRIMPYVIEDMGSK